MTLPTQEGLRSILSDLTAAIDSYSTAPDLHGLMSRVHVIAKAKEIAKTLITPEQLPNYHGLNMAEVLAIRTFIKLNVLEAIPLDGAISLQELSKKTGAAESLLERMARILVGTGFLDQTLPDGGDYKHTRFSVSYRTSQPGPGQLFLAMYDEWFKNMHNFDDYLVDRGQLEHAQEPSDPLCNPYTWTHKQDGTPVWAIMAQSPEKIQTFQVGMSGLDIAIPPTGHFDFNSLAGDDDTIQLIDVGGGHGVVLRQIIDVYPALNPAKCVLQERPDVIEMARASKALPESTILMPHDFTIEQPIKGAKAYFLRMILHDYVDSVGIAILSHLAAAMSPTSRVLICEMVIPQRVSEADFASAVLDQAVMTMGGKERT